MPETTEDTLHRRDRRGRRRPQRARPPADYDGAPDERRCSSPEARASSARTSSARCSSAATASACSTTSRPATAPTSTASTSRWSRASCAATSASTTPSAGVEVVFHLGALGSVPRSVQDPLTSSAVNVEGTLNVLLAARDEGVRRVVFSSSSSVYGTQSRAPGPGGARARPDLAVRRRQARRRALLHLVLPRLRELRERRRPVLQRLRPAPEPVLAVRGRGPAVHHGDRRRPAGAGSTGTASSAATSPTSTNVVDGTLCAADDAGRQRADLQRRRELAGERQPGRRDDRHASSGGTVETDAGAAAGRRHPRLVGGRHGGARDARLGAVRSVSRKGSAARSSSFEPPRNRIDPVPSSPVTRGRADPRPPGDRPAEHGRAGAARRVPLGRPARPRLRDDARRRRASARARSRWRTSRRGSGVPVTTLPAPAPGDLAGPRPARDLPPRPDDAGARPHILHTHTAKAGAIGRVAALLAGRAGRRSSCTPSTATSCAATSAGSGHGSSGWLERLLARVTDALIAVSPEVRDDLVALGVAPASKFTVIRLGIELDERVADDGGRARRDAARDGDPGRAIRRSAGSAG